MGKTGKEVIVVGGGLAGLAAAMKLAENGCHVKISFGHESETISFCLRPRRHQCGDEFERLKKTLRSSMPTIRSRAGIFSPISRLFWKCVLPGLALSACSTASAVLSTALLKGISIFADLAGLFITAPLFAALRQASSCFILWTSKCAAMKRKGKVEKFENHEFMRLVLDEEGCARGIVIMNLLNHDEARGVEGRCCRVWNRGPRAYF